MVLPLLAITAIPTTIGVWQTVEEGKKAKKEAADERRMQKFNLEVYSDASEVNGLRVVLRDNKKKKKKEQANLSPSFYPKTQLYLDDPNPPPSNPPKPESHPQSHPFAGFYIAYPPLDPETPSPQIRGLVSTISNDPPMLNWIYADRETGEVRYGNRTQSRGHVFGSWDWTEDLEGLVLEGWEGFVVVEEEEEEEEGVGVDEGEGDGKGKGKGKGEGEGRVWAVYYDRKRDGLKSVFGKGGKMGRRVLEVSLERKVIA
ncbi:MAG: hypothetical protein M1835_006642 [Candelina submexicana]|nr:MAG: hypothetical protein M1835_006642 [Candelina submexicana]